MFKHFKIYTQAEQQIIMISKWCQNDYSKMIIKSNFSIHFNVISS